MLKVLEGCYRHVRDGHFFLTSTGPRLGKPQQEIPKVTGVPLFSHGW